MCWMIHSLEVQTTPSSLRTSFPSCLPIAPLQGVKVDVVSIQLVSRVIVSVMLDGQVITVQQVHHSIAAVCTLSSN